MSKRIKRMVVAGDSILWSQGMKLGDKLHVQALRMINGATVRTAASEDAENAIEGVLHRARSGAVGRWGDEELGTRGEPLEPLPTQLWGTASGSGSSWSTTQDGAHPVAHPQPMWRAIPWSTPTTQDQLEAGLPSGWSAEEVDAVLLNGGSNDVGMVERVATDSSASDADLQEMLRLVEKEFSDQRHVIAAARRTYPNAAIFVLGYFAPVSEQSSDDPSGGHIPAAGVKEVGRYRSRRFYERQLALLHRWVAAAHERDRRHGHPGTYLINPGFGPQHAIYAPDSFFIESSTFGWQSVTRAISDPTGATRLIASGLTDPRRTDRAEVAERYLDAGAIQASDAATTKAAAFAHLNEAGCRRYAEQIHQTWSERWGVSLRDHATRLAGRNSRVSLRGALGRYGFKNRLSMLAVTPHFWVDCVDVETKTGPSAWDNDGTDAFVYLRFEDGRRHKLNVDWWYKFENMFDHGDHDFASVAPTALQGRPDDRVHLSEVTQMTFEIENGGLSLVDDDWRIEQATFRINGRVVWTGSVKRTIDPGGTTTWTAPGFPAPYRP